MKHLYIKNFLWTLTALILIFQSGGVFGQVIVPRAGYPYCQPFTGNGNPNDLPFTVAKGNKIDNYNPLTLSNRNLILTGQALQLTSSEEDLRGYVFIDLPFSSTYGMKASFEYFIHDPSPSGLGDGLSFFMFNGEIDEATFQIGGVGGSLGYAPHGSNTTGGYTSGGVTGGYIGIGFDVLGNFGNYQEKKYGGFDNPNQFNFTTPVNEAKFYPNSVVIRGSLNGNDPLRYNGAPAGNMQNLVRDSYQFVNGRLTLEPDFPYPSAFVNTAVVNGSGSIDPNSPEYLAPNKRFKIGSGLQPSNINCQANLPIGYRKVFIDLKPTLNPAIPYTISVDMLVVKDNGEQGVIPIFKEVPYPYQAPNNLKVGFSASTGGQFYSEIDIRNVTVQVSDTERLEPLNTPNIDVDFCEGENDKEIPINVPLSDGNSFIRCVQLYLVNETPLSPPPFDQGGNSQFGCGLDDVCGFEFCLNGNEPKVVPGMGTFKIEEIDENQNIGEIQILFTPEPGFNNGTATVVYTVTDNYGQVSEPRNINVTYTPLPKLTSEVIEGPTCDGRSDGSIQNIILSDLSNSVFDPATKSGYTFQWYSGTGASVNPITGEIEDIINPQPLNGGTIEGISGLNLGNYYLEITNFSGGDGCPRILEFVIDEIRGSPVEIDLDNIVICEGSPAIFQPNLPPGYAGNPTFLWYTDANKSPGSEITDNQTVGNISYNISANGELSVNGLAPSGPGQEYEYFVEVQEDASQNFCDLDPGELIGVKVAVLPGIIVNVIKLEDDLCLENTGEIQIQASAGASAYTIELWDINSSQLAKPPVTVNSGNHTFTEVPKGDYRVEVRSGTTAVCEFFSDPIEILGPAEPFQISEVGSIDPGCSEPNGSITFSVSGGTPIETGGLPFTIEVFDFSIPGNNTDLANTIVDNNDGTYTVSDLDTEVYRITLFDANGCSTILNKSFPPAIFAEFAVNDIEVCLGETATLEAIVTVPGDPPAEPAFVWYSDINGSPIQAGVDPDNAAVTYTLTDTQLQIDGLAPGEHTFYLKPEGPYVCFDPVEEATITVTQPIDATVSSLPADCFEASTGSISVALGDGLNLDDFEFFLEGISIDYQASPDFNNLPAGTYTVLVRDLGSVCSTPLEIDVAQPDPVEVINEIPTNPTCGATNGIVSFEVNGGTGDYSIQVNGQGLDSFQNTQSGNVFTIRNLAPGTYSLVISDENQCTVSYPDLFTLTDDPGIEVDLEPIFEEVCEGQGVVFSPVYSTSEPVTPVFNWFEDQALNIPVQNTTGSPVSYQVDASDGTLTVSGLEAGTYSYYLEVSGAGICSFVAEAEVIVYPAIEAQIVKTNEGCIGAEDGTITFTPLGGNGNYEFSFNNSPFSTIQSYSDLAPGTYTLVIRNDLGCSTTYTIEIEGVSAPITINDPDLIRASCGLENGGINNLQISGGWGDYQVEWRKGSETGPVVSTSLTGASDLGPDTYFLIVTDKEGCEEVFEFDIEESSDPVYQVVDPVDVCFGVPNTIRPIHIAPDPTLPPTAFTEVKWYREQGQVGLIENGPDPDNPTIVYTIDDTDWLNPQLLIENLPAGIHEFYFYVECTGQELKAELTVYETPEVVLDPSPITCFGDTNGRILLSSGTQGDYIYVLNGAAPVSQEELEDLNLAPGAYTLEVITPAGCPQIISFDIESPPASLAISGISKVDPGCGASNGRIEATITGGWAPYSVSVRKDGSIVDTITSNDGVISLTGLTTGIFVLEIADAEGCVLVSDQVELIDGPTQILLDDLEICFGEDAVLIPELDPISADAVYAWSFDAAGNNLIVSGSTVAGVGYQIDSDGVLTISGLTSSNTAYSFYLSVSGPGVCSGDLAEAEVMVFDLPQASFDVQNEVCFGEGGQIRIEASGGSGTYTYSLNGQPAQESNIFDVSTGTYSVLVNTPQDCYIELSDIQVSGPDEALSISDLSLTNPTCELANGIITFEINGGYGGYSVVVIKDDVPIETLDADENGLVTVRELGSGTIQFDITDSQGCVISLDEPIEFEEVPTEIFAEDQEICEGDVAQLDPRVPANIEDADFTWYFDANEAQPIPIGMIDGIEYSINASGGLSITGLAPQDTPYTYYVMAEGPGICGVEPKAVDVLVSPIPPLRVSNPSVVCDPEGTVNLIEFIEGFNADLYDYDIVNPAGSELRLDELTAVSLSGDYRVSSSFKDLNCWNTSQRIRVIISDSLHIARFQYQADLGNDIIVTNDTVQVQEPVEFQDLSQGRVIIWNWDFGDGSVSTQQNPVHTYMDKGTFIVTLSTVDEFGCESFYQMEITADDIFDVVIPNAFTPDGMKNQTFKPLYRGIVSMEFYIFNTWGDMIYRATSLEDQGWDGTLNGTPAPNGNYVYSGKFTTRAGEVIEKTGVFILIR